MSDITPNPDGEMPEFDFSLLNVDDVPPEDAPPSFDPPRKPRWWERAKGKNGAVKEPRPSKPKKSVTMPRSGLRGPLEDFYTGIGMFMMPFDPACGKVVIEAAPKCAESLDELAKTNPAVRRLLIQLVSTSAMGMVVVAHAPIVMAIAMHHVPMLRKKQEQMVGEFAEMMANGFGSQPTAEDEGE
jgi:hypothetical protein